MGAGLAAEGVDPFAGPGDPVAAPGDPVAALGDPVAAPGVPGDDPAHRRRARAERQGAVRMKRRTQGRAARETLSESTNKAMNLMAKVS